eukprot:NODE_8597_length_692_cov_100.637961_g8339_i0.p1 GENE.NODE_8597_length_692_cov_100.637961_g8339_i0~~NODE_8597_length_692_cov_100.637961_g8339_i0.p1  ORF type:complete len:168 (+),score=26.98 NODE_8597_length_692_cov_100.637961_g8339_i0:44-505(+)
MPPVCGIHVTMGRVVAFVGISLGILVLLLTLRSARVEKKLSTVASENVVLQHELQDEIERRLRERHGEISSNLSGNGPLLHLNLTNPERSLSIVRTYMIDRSCAGKDIVLHKSDVEDLQLRNFTTATQTDGTNLVNLMPALLVFPTQVATAYQ